MGAAGHEHEQLAREHRALMRHYGEAQVRCTEQARSQCEEVSRLRAEAMRLRAAVIVRDTALGWAREDAAALQAEMLALPAAAPRRAARS